MTACSDHDSAMSTFKTYIKYMYGEKRLMWMDRCPVPCIQTSYTYEKKKMHANSWLNPGNASLSPIKGHNRTNTVELQYFFY